MVLNQYTPNNIEMLYLCKKYNMIVFFFHISSNIINIIEYKYFITSCVT